MPKTYHDKYVTALIARGWRIDATAQSKKYTVMVQCSDARGVFDGRMPDPMTKMFVGKSGAVRYGRTASESFSMHEAMKNRLLTTVLEPAAEKVP